MVLFIEESWWKTKSMDKRTGAFRKNTFRSTEYTCPNESRIVQSYVPLITKASTKAIMKSPELENKYAKERQLKN